MILPDLLHTMDLGVTQWVAGAVLYEMLQEPDFGRAKEARLQRLQRELDHWRHTVRARDTVDRLSESMICRAGKSPSLAAKAAETRRLAPFLLALCETWGAAEASPLHRRRYTGGHYTMRLACVRACVLFYSGLAADPVDLARTRLQGHRLLRLYAALHDEARAAGDPSRANSGPSCLTTYHGP